MVIRRIEFHFEKELVNYHYHDHDEHHHEHHHDRHDHHSHHGHHGSHLWEEVVNEGAEGEPVCPAVGEVGDVHILEELKTNVKINLSSAFLRHVLSKNECHMFGV